MKNKKKQSLKTPFSQSLHRTHPSLAEPTAIGFNMHAVVWNLNTSPYTRAPQTLESPSCSRNFKVSFHFLLSVAQSFFGFLLIKLTCLFLVGLEVFLSSCFTLAEIVSFPSNSIAV